MRKKAKPLGVARERNGMVNVSDIIDTCRLHAKGLGYKLSAYGAGIGPDNMDTLGDSVIRITDAELRILLDTLRRANPGLTPEQLLDRHCEGLGLGDDRYAHPVVALYVAMRHSPIAAVTIINLMLRKLNTILDLRPSTAMNTDNVLIDQLAEKKVERLRLKAKNGLGFTPSETKFLNRYYAKDRPDWLLSSIDSTNKQLTELSKGSVYRKYAPNATEKLAQSKPFKISTRYPEVAKILKATKGRRV